jgi:hypothetical protein
MGEAFERKRNALSDGVLKKKYIFVNELLIQESFLRMSTNS